MNNEVRKEIYNFGYDAAVNGTNTTNCYFAIFCNKTSAQIWQDGYDKGKKECTDILKKK